MTRHQIKDAFEIEFREPPTYDITTNRDTWTGTLLLGGEETGVTATCVASRFEYHNSDTVKAEIMVYAIREFTRRWRVAADAEAELKDIKERIGTLEKRAFGTRGGW